MKTLILYSGHLGSTRRAAEILAGMIGEVTVLDTAMKPKVEFREYDKIVFGTNVRMFMLNGRFKKYAKKWLKTKSEAKVFAYIMGASAEKKEEYISKAIKILGNNSVVHFVGGELNFEKARGFTKKIIESVKAEFISKNQALPSIDETALVNLAKAIIQR